MNKADISMELDAYYKARKMKIVKMFSTLLSSPEFFKRDFSGVLVTSFSSMELAVHRPLMKEVFETSQKLKLVGLGSSDAVGQ